MSKLDELRKSCLACMDCPLGATRTNLVFGVGNENTAVMFVGEGPGEQEDLRGEPFVGRAGKLLDDMLAMIDLDRSMVYIANAVKCRPPGNRDPLESEQDACWRWLEAQIEAIDPKVIVCLGRIAAMRLIKPDFKITKEHGKWFDIGGRELTAIYHPAALLRDPGRRPETFDDLKEIQKKLKTLQMGLK
jgi:DNA polymerase